MAELADLIYLLAVVVVSQGVPPAAVNAELERPGLGQNL